MVKQKWISIEMSPKRTKRFILITFFIMSLIEENIYILCWKSYILLYMAKWTTLMNLTIRISWFLYIFLKSTKTCLPGFGILQTIPYCRLISRLISPFFGPQAPHHPPHLPSMSCPVASRVSTWLGFPYDEKLHCDWWKKRHTDFFLLTL